MDFAWIQWGYFDRANVRRAGPPSGLATWGIPPRTQPIPLGLNLFG
ncbi:hypothetical protein VB780_16000 [Leptolyngbya sp. CCNP1308]|nr:hypothetical protein [Leptolyngbya sp. CCNP1308]MEA5450084.1 hypothetical protein [Leptolyngbya sp. CCNP1308]